MINKSQYIYDVVYKELSEILGEDNVYYSVPMKPETPYPFAVVEDTQSITQTNKNTIFEKVYINVSLWSDINNRYVLGDISLKLKNNLLKYNLLTNEVSEQLLNDTSTDDVLFHLMLSLAFFV